MPDAQISSHLTGQPFEFHSPNWRAFLTRLPLKIRLIAAFIQQGVVRFGSNLAKGRCCTYYRPHCAKVFFDITGYVQSATRYEHLCHGSRKSTCENAAFFVTCLPPRIGEIDVDRTGARCGNKL